MGAAAVILDGQGRVLLVRHGYGMRNWELPGGMAEPGESILDTALREVREETSLVVVPQRLTGIYYEPHEDFHQFVFLCRRLDETKELTLDPSEITDVGYWELSTLPRPISDFTMRRIHDALAGDSQVLPVSIAPRRWLE